MHKTHTHTHTHTCTHTHKQHIQHTPMHTHTYAHMHTHTHTCTHAHTHIPRWFQEPAVKRNYCIVLGAWFLVFIGIGKCIPQCVSHDLLCCHVTILPSSHSLYYSWDYSGDPVSCRLVYKTQSNCRLNNQSQD